MKTHIDPPRESWKSLCQRPVLQNDFLESAVNNILNRVRQSGDLALIQFTQEFDKVGLGSLRVTDQEIAGAGARLSPELKTAISIAADNIRKFHASQLRSEVKVETTPGVVCWQKTIAIEKVGVYIPGGQAPLFSTVLMLGVPALIAGCRQVILCSPPDVSGAINDSILFAASVVGIREIFKVGGAQAIAAMAYGTATIPAVNKIFGPGNQYVTKAKQMVNLQGTAIDIPAGPSEVMVLADASANPAFIASDLLAQAEHGADSQVVLVTTSEKVVASVAAEIERQISVLPRKSVAETALSASLSVVLKSNRDMVDFANEYAPEHLIIQTNDCEEIAEQIVNAGSIFIGAFSPESAGDYASGTNHTLPTNGYAKASGGVSLDSFVKYVTFQKLSKDGLKRLGPVVETMAAAESLDAHKQSISIRLRDLK